jgi:hypothetical protein
MLNLRSESHATLRPEAQRLTPAQVIAIADALNLCWVGDGPQDRPECKLILSELPIGPDRQALLNINQPLRAAWRGTVAIYLGRAGMMRANGDPEHPERYAVWGDAFVCGDPELIARLQSCAR